eukprot:6192495-Pleurochrysis_carterae.AAC.1
MIPPRGSFYEGSLRIGRAVLPARWHHSAHMLRAGCLSESKVASTKLLMYKAKEIHAQTSLYSYCAAHINMSAYAPRGLAYTLQFPISVAFAMTINKSQGQTLDRAGVYLANNCFTHDQLYVAASRVRDADHLRFCKSISQPRTQQHADLTETVSASHTTANVVFKEAFAR